MRDNGSVLQGTDGGYEGVVGRGGRKDRQTYRPIAWRCSPSSSACPLSCTLLTSRAVTGLSEPITGCHAVCQPCTSLDRMTSNFWCYVSRTIWKQMSSLLGRQCFRNTTYSPLFFADQGIKKHGLIFLFNLIFDWFLIFCRLAVSMKMSKNNERFRKKLHTFYHKTHQFSSNKCHKSAKKQSHNPKTFF